MTATLHVRRLISVLVTDIRDFTGLTRQTDEKILSEMIGTWFRQAGDILRKHGSWVDKYIGDAIMAVWIHGENDLSLDEVKHIFQAVDDLQHMTQSLYQRYPLPFPLRIGTGINTGYAMVGNTGSYDRPDYTALGDTVNEAFRLESCTKELQRDVAIGLTTYQYLRMLHPGNYGQQMFEEYEVHLKGYDQPATTYAGTYGELHEVLRGLEQETVELDQGETNLEQETGRSQGMGGMGDRRQDNPQRPEESGPRPDGLQMLLADGLAESLSDSWGEDWETGEEGLLGLVEDGEPE